MLARYLMVILAGVALALPASADEYEGIVNSVQYNYFTILGQKNSVSRIMLKANTNMPQGVMSGVLIRCTAVKNEITGELILEEIEELSKTSLSPPPEPGINVPFTNGKVYVPIP